MEDYMDEEARQNSKKTHPYATANIVSKIFFTWMFPLFIKGLKRDLLEDDLYGHLQSHESTYLGDKLEKEWFLELKRKGDNPSLWRALRRVFGKELFWLGLFYFFIELIVRIGLPIFLSQLLVYHEPNSTMTKQEAYFYATAIGLCSLSSGICIHTYMLHNQHLGMKIRVATSTLVYRKALKLSKSALGETTVGQMVNLISNDVGRFETVTTNIHSLWIAPLKTITVLILMYFYTGPTGIVGVGLVLSFIPFQIWMGKKTSEFRLATAIRTDERIRLMNEIISGIQVIKMYTWEKPFAKLVELSRRREIDQIKKISVIRAIMMSFGLFLNRAAIYLCIMTYVITGSILTAKYVYVLQCFYGILRMSVTVHFPMGITQFAEANISIKRIWKFLMYEEVNFDSSATFLNAVQSKDDLKHISNGVRKLDESACIYIKNASVKWIKTRTENTLEDLNIDVKSNELAAFIGLVGSGKSTLLHAILGELPPTSGIIAIKGRISYASQEPWLFVGSVRQNILFGQKFDARKYYEVVRVCQLERDFKLFPYKDHTIVRERGVSLSGGQRARINLARAVYKDADIYLLDDPLSAVDAHVGKQLFEQCITGYLKIKCVVLVTHQLQYLKNVQKIYLLGDGKIDHCGTYEEIQATGGKFTQLLNDLKDIIDEDDEEKDENAKASEDIKPTRLRRISTKEVMPKSDKDPKLVLESRQRGKVTWAVYKSYLVSGGHWCKILTLFITFVIAQVVGTLADYFLNWWVNMNQIKLTEIIANNASNIPMSPSLKRNLSDDFPIETPNSNFTLINVNNTHQCEHTAFQNFWHTYMEKDVLLITYSIVICAVITLTVGISLAFYRFCNKASIRLHNNMFYKIVYATMRFFNVNPSGRILNRFSKDMNQVDELLPMTLLDTLQIVYATMGFLNANLSGRILNRFSKDMNQVDELLPLTLLDTLQMSLIVTAITTVIATVNPWILLPTLLMLTIFYFMRVVFLATSRNIKRLEGITRSPVYSHLTASLQGLTTIRAFGAQEILKNEFDNYQNAYSSAYFMFVGANRTFGFWLDMHCAAFIMFITLSFLIFDTESFGGNVGLSITQALNLMGMFQWGMRQWSELENTMTCVERIKEYADVVPEQELDTKDPPKSWPDEGNIKFDNLSLSYSTGEPPVLRNLNFDVKSAEKVGIVGRTGAGKSSIIMALFRLAINEGRIIIDGVDTSKIRLRKLRSCVAITPQEPVLFSGTLRKNLDPFDEHTDEALWSALEEVELKSAVSDLPQGLESKVSEGGSNFSIGQRQLVCLARAIVRKNKILVLDEATANVDPQTDALIQTTIREKFSECTVLTIAHRLHTIMDSDKVLVMDAGRVVEFGHPHELLQKTEYGVFYELVHQTGRAMAENLISIAEENYKKNAELKRELKINEVS